MAAIKAYSHFLDILIEPSVAFHELAHKQGNQAANEELAWFRIGDDADAFAWCDYALGRVDRVASVAPCSQHRSIALSCSDARWLAPPPGIA